MTARQARAAKRRKSKRTGWRKLAPHEIGAATRWWLEYDRAMKAMLDNARKVQQWKPEDWR